MGAQLISQVSAASDSMSQTFRINKSWDGKATGHPPILLTLQEEHDGAALKVTISSPYFEDPAPEGGRPGEAFFKLWEYEVVEAFFLNNDDQYLELEFGPHGQHLMLLLDGRRNAIKHSLPLDYTAVIDEKSNTWKGKALVPLSYFPPNVTLFNAYAINGVGDQRIYEALYESSGKQPDFHRLEKFQPLDFSTLLPENNSPN